MIFTKKTNENLNMLKTILILFYLIISTKANGLIYDCQKINSTIIIDKYYATRITNSIIKNFNDFKELKFNCTDMVFDFDLIQFIPNKELILDKVPNIQDLKLSTDVLTIHFVFLKGIDIGDNSNFKRISNISNFFDISYSKLRIYLNGRLFDESSCLSYKRKANNIFTEINYLVLRNYVG